LPNYDLMQGHLQSNSRLKWYYGVGFLDRYICTITEGVEGIGFYSYSIVMRVSYTWAVSGY